MAANTLRRRFDRLEESRAMLERRERNLVIEARENGWSWDRIADQLGLTRQGVRSRYKDLPARLNRDGEVDQ